MRYDFKDYLPATYKTLIHKELKEKIFPDKRTYHEYLVWKYDCLRQYNVQKVNEEREKMKDREYQIEQQCQRGISVIENTIKGEAFDERIDILLSGKENDV